MRRFFVGLLATVGFFALAGTVLAAFLSFSTDRPGVPSRTALEIDWRVLPRESAGEGLTGGLFGRDRPTLADTIETLRRAAADKRVTGIVATLGDDWPGLAAVQELRDAIAAFRASGKFTIAWAPSFEDGPGGIGNWYLATAFERVWMQPSGEFAVTGFATQVPLLKGGLDKLGVRFEGGQRHEFKAAPNSFTETGLTKPHRDNLQALVDSMLGQVVADTARARGIEPAAVRRLIDAAPLGAAEAVAGKLIDRIGYRDEVLDDVYKRLGDRDTYEFEDYVARALSRSGKGDVIALVAAHGTMHDSEEGDPFEAGEALTRAPFSRALFDAVGDPDVKAVVVRIDSPGGSVVAADALRRAVERAKGAGKPIIVSMGNVAASGGYLMALSADLVVAQPGSVTGSIGVFGLKPVVAGLLDTLGVKLEDIAAGTNAAMGSPARSYTPAQQALVDRQLDRIYADFTARVAAARKLDAGQIDKVARGRVFTGLDAKKAGLVDELGGLTLAIGFAKARAGIDAGRDVQIRRFPAERSRIDRVVDLVTGKHAKAVARAETRRMVAAVETHLGGLPLAWRPSALRLPPLAPLWR